MKGGVMGMAVTRAGVAGVVTEALVAAMVLAASEKEE